MTAAAGGTSRATRRPATGTDPHSQPGRAAPASPATGPSAVVGPSNAHRSATTTVTLTGPDGAPELHSADPMNPLAYPIRDGIPILLADEARPITEPARR